MYCISSDKRPISADPLTGGRRGVGRSGGEVSALHRAEPGKERIPQLFASHALPLKCWDVVLSPSWYAWATARVSVAMKPLPNHSVLSEDFPSSSR